MFALSWASCRACIEQQQAAGITRTQGRSRRAQPYITVTRASCCFAFLVGRVEYTEEDLKPQLEDACKVDCLKEWHNYKVTERSAADASCTFAHLWQ